MELDGALESADESQFKEITKTQNYPFQIRSKIKIYFTILSTLDYDWQKSNSEKGHFHLEKTKDTVTKNRENKIHRKFRENFRENI